MWHLDMYDYGSGHQPMKSTGGLTHCYQEVGYYRVGNDANYGTSLTDPSEILCISRNQGART